MRRAYHVRTEFWWQYWKRLIGVQKSREIYDTIPVKKLFQRDFLPEPLEHWKIMDVQGDSSIRSAAQNNTISSEEGSPPLKRKRYTTAKDRREHLNRTFKYRKGNRDEDRSSDRNKEESSDKTNGDVTGNIAIEKEPRKPKRKVAVLVGFCGTGYQGMQINRNAKTIEEDLFKAFVAAGAISKDNSDDPRKVSLMRAARTDKGVHAAGNLISILFFYMIIGIPNLVEKINENLADQIRVWGFVQTIRSFHAKTLCDSRIYEYLLPTYVFIPRERDQIVSSIGQLSTDQNDQTQFVEVPLATAEEMIEKRKYRIPSRTLDLVRQGFKAYEGTHNYHNFTLGRSPMEKSCNRFIMSFEVSDPKMVHVRDSKTGDQNVTEDNECNEWLSLKVHGQSFMLHQIRKMVALIVMMIRTETSLSLIHKTFGNTKINIPKAPALGLLLDQPVFKSYNKKAVDNGKELIEFDIHKGKIDAFKEKFIYSKIYDEEFLENTFQNWLNSIDYHTERDYGYLNREGEIPECAIVVNPKENFNKDADDENQEENDSD
ncbi:13857_t:CDS:10 [Cetraspora pellucida]|uniref:13857_t:CDS:1 n=1 Tax=Cetraspora pellucida TaxID=1433469 RepID=A0A9N9NQC9_9GLOM|nr:13857_t:CDS:10 [Cetraspora pellucida]